MPDVNQPVGPTYSIGESLRASLPAGLAGAIIGAIIGVLLSLFAIFNLGLSGLIGTIILATFGLIIGFIVVYIITFVWYILPSWLKKPVTYLLIIVFIGLIIWIAIFFWRLPLTGEYLKFASPVFDGLAKGWRDLRTSWGACLYLKPPCPFLVDWETPNVQSAQEELNIDVRFSEAKISKQNEIYVLVSLTVTNPELSELIVKPRCFLGKDKVRELNVESMGSYAKGDEFVFGTTSRGQELHTSFRCSGEIYEAGDKPLYSDYLVVVLERPVSVKTTWPVQIKRGEGPNLGLVKSTMQFNAPYSIAFASDNDMPFLEGREYSFNIVLKRRQENAKFKELNYISVKFPDDLMIECKGFVGSDHKLELREHDYESLKKIAQYSESEDKFSWPCKLYVSEAPPQAVLAPVSLESKYVVYSESSVRIIKS
ncbi:MAG: hypothetical protein QXK80_03415 [Candidatus Pacearchaeota archaeon]